MVFSCICTTWHYISILSWKSHITASESANCGVQFAISLLNSWNLKFIFICSACALVFHRLSEIFWEVLSESKKSPSFRSSVQVTLLPMSLKPICMSTCHLGSTSWTQAYFHCVLSVSSSRRAQVVALPFSFIPSYFLSQTIARLGGNFWVLQG